MPTDTVIVIVRDGQRSIHAADRAVFSLLLEGPGCLEAVASLRSVEQLPERLHAGWLADFDARRVVLYHSKKGDVLLPPIKQMGNVYARWEHFSVRWTDDDSGGLTAYVAGDHRIFDEVSDSSSESPNPLLEGRLDQLHEEERALPPLPPEKSGLLGTAAFILAFLVLAPIALVVRLATIPFRRRLLERLDASERLRRRRNAEEMQRQLAALETEGIAVDAGFHRGLALFLGARWIEAELEFDACARSLEGGEVGRRVSLAQALHNRGVARGHLRLRALAARDRKRAEGLDPTLNAAAQPKLRSRLRTYGEMSGGLFLVIAGLID